MSGNAQTQQNRNNNNNNNSSSNNNSKVGEEQVGEPPSTPNVQDEGEIMAALAATADFVNTPTTPITPHFPKPSPTLMVVSSSSNSPFDINLVCDRFLRSISDKAAIDTLLYLQGFTELNKFFNMFGTLFGFVAKDVRDKIGILEAYHADETAGHRYVTVQSMIEYEKGESLLIDKTGRRPSGARTLLRLHRALEFISAFLHEVTKIDDQTSTGGSARAAYGRTLARFHPWMIRKTVNLATLALPYRRVLISNVYGGALPEGGAGEVNEAMSELANIADQVFGATHKLYEEHELLELP